MVNALLGCVGLPPSVASGARVREGSATAFCARYNRAARRAVELAAASKAKAAESAAPNPELFTILYCESKLAVSCGKADLAVLDLYLACTESNLSGVDSAGPGSMEKCLEPHPRISPECRAIFFDMFNEDDPPVPMRGPLRPPGR